MQQETGLSIDVVRIVQALVLLFVAADVIVRTIFRIKTQDRRRVRRAAARAPVGEQRHDRERRPRPCAASRASAASRPSACCSACSASCWSATSRPTSNPPTRRSPSSRRPIRPSISFDPRTIVIAIGHLLRAHRGRLPARARATSATHEPALLDLDGPASRRSIVILSLALSEAGDTNVIQLLVESLRLGHADRARRDGGPLVRAIGRRQHRHRGHDAGRRRRRLHDLRGARRRAGAPAWLWIAHRASRCSPAGSSRALHALVSVTLPGRPDHLGRRDQPARARAHQLPAVPGDRAPRDLDRRQHVRDLAPAAVRHPGRRRAAVHEQADLLRDVRDRRRSPGSCCSGRRGACGSGRAARTRTRPRRSAST